MNNRRKLIIIILCLVWCSQCFCENKYIDGIYEDESQSIYTGEQYWGQVQVVIKKNKIIDFSFKILDKRLKRIFDKTYEEVFKGNQTYILQCRNDLEGLNKYIAEFNKSKDLSKIDAISGATWSYNIFKDTVKKTLIKAQKK